MSQSRLFRKKRWIAVLLLCAGVLAFFLGEDLANPHASRWWDSLWAVTGGPQLSGDLDLDSGRKGDESVPQLKASEFFEGDGSGIEGRAGHGIHAAVMRSGVWFPVYEPGLRGADANPAETAMARLPLYITSGSPPAVAVGEAMEYRFTAIGGSPPYRWRKSGDADPFEIDSESGVFTGQSEVPLLRELAVHVVDAAGAEDSAVYVLRVGDESPLAIVTEELPDGNAGEFYQTTLVASGGSPPFVWATSEDLPADFHLDSSSGLLTGLSRSGIERELRLRVTDAVGQKVEQNFLLRVRSLMEIVTPANLPPAAPGASFEFRFEVEGGTPPYRWRVLSGHLPMSADGQSWSLSPDGIFLGTAPSTESVHRFTVEVSDDLGLIVEKEFQFAIRRSLVVVPSREKAGLAWQPAEIERAIGESVSAVTITRSLSSEGSDARVVYQGWATNFVDRNLVTGVTYFYTLHAHVAGGSPVAVATTATRILPFTTGRGVPGQLADPYADAVKSFKPLSGGGYGAAFLSGNVTGPPDGMGVFSPASRPDQVVSLHARIGKPDDSLSVHGGSMTLAFEDNIVEIRPGVDLTVFENVFFVNGDPNQRFMEPAVVSVALFEGQWHRFPVEVVPPASSSSTPPTMDPFYYNRGFAGRNPTTGDDPTQPERSGGDPFDVSQLKIPDLTWIRYVRIQSTGHNVMRDDAGSHPIQHPVEFGAASGSGSSGFDLDGVSAVHY